MTHWLFAGHTADEGGYQTTLLRLQKADTEKTGKAPLKNVRFSYVIEQGVVEDTIAASCGQFFVTWSFRRCVCGHNSQAVSTPL